MPSSRFDQWYASVYAEWYTDKKDELYTVWLRLCGYGMLPDDVAEVFDTITTAIRDQYGD